MRPYLIYCILICARWALLSAMDYRKCINDCYPDNLQCLHVSFISVTVLWLYKLQQLGYQSSVIMAILPSLNIADQHINLHYSEGINCIFLLDRIVCFLCDTAGHITQPTGGVFLMQWWPSLLLAGSDFTKSFHNDNIPPACKMFDRAGGTLNSLIACSTSTLTS